MILLIPRCGNFCVCHCFQVEALYRSRNLGVPVWDDKIRSISADVALHQSGVGDGGTWIANWMGGFSNQLIRWTESIEGQGILIRYGLIRRAWRQRCRLGRMFRYMCTDSGGRFCVLSVQCEGSTCEIVPNSTAGLAKIM